MRNLKEIKTSDIKLGMRYSAPVFFDDGTNMFLAENKPIKQFHLDAIKQWKIKKVVTYGRLIDSNNKGDLTENSDIDELEELEDLEEIEELEELEEPECPERIEDIILSSKYTDTLSFLSKKYDNAVKNMTDVFAAATQNLSAFETKTESKTKRTYRQLIDETVDSLLSIVKMDGSGFVSFVLNKGSSAKYPFSAVNIAVMAGAAAFYLDIPDRKIRQTMTAALLHDICMPAVPSEITNKKGKLTSSEFELLKMHTVRGSSYITDTLLLPKDVATAVLQHHEYYDGGGYPEGRSGEDIDLSARIIAVCDAFEAMVSEKPYRNALIGYEAVKGLLKKAGSQFDPEVVRCVVKSTGVYPAGTLVLMSNISVARVIESSDDSLFLPVVRIVAKGRGEIETGTVVNLKEQRSVFIIRPLSREEAVKFA